MGQSSLIVAFAITYVVNRIGGTRIWYDNGERQASWVPSEVDSATACYDEGVKNDECSSGYCHRLHMECSLERSTPIADYAGHPLQLSFWIDASDLSSNDRCEIWFRYDNDGYSNNPDWECGACVKGVTTVDIPPSTTRNTLKIKLSIHDTGHHHCNFDNIQLLYLPTPEPTKKPTPQPTGNPTPNPTKAPTLAPTKQPTPAPTMEPTAAPTKQPSTTPTQSPSSVATLSPTMATIAPSSESVPIRITTQNLIDNPMITTQGNPMENDVTTATNIENTGHIAIQQDPMSFVYVAAGALVLILLLAGVVGLLFVLKGTSVQDVKKHISVHMSNRNVLNINVLYGTNPNKNRRRATTDALATDAAVHSVSPESSASLQCVTIHIQTDKVDDIGHKEPIPFDKAEGGRVTGVQISDNDEIYTTEEVSEPQTEEDEGHHEDHEATNRGSVMHISDNVPITGGNEVDEEQKEDVILDAMLSDILEMQNLDPNKIHQINLNNSVNQANNNSDSDESDKIYQH